MTSNLNNKNILVVDDEEDIREIVVFEFRRYGCLTFEAPSGNEALEIVSKQPIDLVVADIKMPNGDGIQLAETLTGTKPNLPIILMTGFKGVDLRKAKVRSVISKPIDRKRLVQLAEEALLAKV